MGGTTRHPQRSEGPERQRRMAEADYFASRWKGGRYETCGSQSPRRRKKVGRRHCKLEPAVGPIALLKAGRGGARKNVDDRCDYASERYREHRLRGR